VEYTEATAKQTAVAVCQWEAVEPGGCGTKTSPEEEIVEGKRGKEGFPYPQFKAIL
jgi:hypothetical protein